MVELDEGGKNAFEQWKAQAVGHAIKLHDWDGPEPTDRQIDRCRTTKRSSIARSTSVCAFPEPSDY